jgi:hypothetical protein
MARPAHGMIRSHDHRDAGSYQIAGQLEPYRRSDQHRDRAVTAALAVGSVAPDPSRVSITPIRASAHAGVRRRPASSTNDDPALSPQCGDVAVRRRAQPPCESPSMDPGSTTRLAPGSPTAAGKRTVADTAQLPPRWQRIGSVTGRSPTFTRVGGSFTRRSPTTPWPSRVNNGRARGLRDHTAALACCAAIPSTATGAAIWHAETPAPFDSLQNL